MTERVLLAGATGVFGRHVTRVLTGAGYEVIGLGRGAGNTLRADLNDRDQVLRAVAGTRAGIVIHAATALAKPPMRHRDMAATDRLRIEGMHHLVEAAGVVGASRFISELMIFGYGYGPHGAAALTEASPWAPEQSDAGLAAHTEAMRIKEELTFGIPGIEGISLRYGLFYGPGGTDALVPSLRRRALPAPNAATVLPWVELTDAAEAVLAAIRHGKAGQAYNIVDDVPAGFGEYLRAVAVAYGTPRPLSVPAWFFRPIPMLAAMVGTDMRVSNARARAELGWEPRYPSIADGLAALASGRAA